LLKTGIPEIVPLELSRESPDGSWPDEMLQVMGLEFP
jgi:hypothetical protein